MTHLRGSDDAVALDELMAAMGAASTEALFVFMDQYRDDLERVVAGILISLNRRDVLAMRDEVSSLAVSAALVILRRARSWRPDGALPWVWAYRSIRHEVVTQIGHPSVEYDASNHASMRSTAPDRSASSVDLESIADRHPDVGAWIAAVATVASERDRRVHLEYQIQKRLGDPSPAHTVSAMFGLSPANVRQIDRRVRNRLADHAFAASPIGIVLLDV